MNAYMPPTAFFS